MGRREWLALGVWIALLLVLVMLPLWHGHAQAPEGSEFVGFVGLVHDDYQSYLAWMHQATEGKLLFRDLFTSEPHQPRFFHPLFWLMGSAVRVLSLSPLSVWYSVHILGCALLVVAIYRFAAVFLAGAATRMLATVLATTAAGLGWLVTADPGVPYLQRPIDMWLVEANQFGAMTTSFFTLPIALALMLGCMERYLAYLEGGRLRLAVTAGLLALGLTAIHQYDIALLLPVLAVWTLLHEKRRWGGLAVVGLACAPFVLYSVGLVKLDPVISKLAWEMPLPTVGAFVLGYGLPLLLCFMAPLIPAVRQEHPRHRWLVAWLVVALALLLSPIEFRRKLVWGAHVPMCILAVTAGEWLWRRVSTSVLRTTQRRVAGVIVALVLSVVCAIDSCVFYLSLFRRNKELVVGEYLPGAHAEALSWLSARREGGGVVIALDPLVKLIPGRTGLTVFSGHWAQTIDPERKAEFRKAVFTPGGQLDPGLVRRVFDRNRVRFVVLSLDDHAQRSMLDMLPAFPFSSFCRLAFQNDLVVIWEVLSYRPRAETEPWPSGDWFGP